jgi:hypothetical protein
MNKAEALESMRQGNKLRHSFFDAEEWMMIVRGEVVFEDGCRCTVEMFWQDRTEDVWLENWSLFNNS